MISKKNNDKPQAVKLDRLDNLVARVEAAKARADEGRSDMGVVYQEAEALGFHRKAMKEAIRLKNMESDKRNDYLSSLQAYCDYLKIWTQGDLFGEAPKTPAAPSVQSDAAPEPVGTFNFETGRKAAHSGEPIDANPWGKGVKAHATWKSGWEEGKREIEDGLVERPTEAAAAG